MFAINAQVLNIILHLPAVVYLVQQTQIVVLIQMDYSQYADVLVDTP